MNIEEKIKLLVFDWLTGNHMPKQWKTDVFTKTKTSDAGRVYAQLLLVYNFPGWIQLLLALEYMVYTGASAAEVQDILEKVDTYTVKCLAKYFQRTQNI